MGEQTSIRLMKVDHDTMIGMIYSITRPNWGMIRGRSFGSLTLKLASSELWLATFPCFV